MLSDKNGEERQHQTSSGEEKEDPSDVHNEVIKGFHDIKDVAKTKDYDSGPYKLAIECLRKASVREEEESREVTISRCAKILEAMTDHGVLESLSIIYLDTLKDLLPTRFMRNNKFVKFRFDVTNSISSLLVNYTNEISLGFSLEVSKNCNILDAMKMILRVLRNEHVESRIEETMEDLLELTLSLAYNLSMLKNYEIIATLQEHNVTSSIRPYLSSPNEQSRIRALLHLIYVVNDDESVELSQNPEGIKYLMEHLGTAFTSERPSDGFSAKELLRAIEKFAVADANKAYLREIGCMDSLKRFLEDGDTNEKKLVLDILCQLSFDKESARIIKAELSALIKGLETQKPDTEGNEKLSRAAKAVLYMINPDDKIQLARDVPATNSSSPSSKHSHIMISYARADQERVLKIRDFLKENKYKIWIDTENISTELLESIAVGVENAWLVILAISRTYKERPFCRKEANYALKHGKMLLPVKVEEFEPDGWLGFLIADLKYHKFENECSPEAEDLLREVNALYDKQAERKKVVDESSHAMTDAPVKSLNRQDVKQMDKAEVEKLLREYNVNWSCEKTINGKHLICLADLRKSDPVTYNRCLEKDLGITSVTDMTAIKEVLKQLKK